MTLRQAYANDPRARVVAPSFRRDDDSGAFAVATDASPGVDAEVVEGREFEVFDVPLVNESGFTHFMDGAERKWRVGFYGFYPVYFAHMSAGVLERAERALRPPPIDRYSTGGLECFGPEAGLAGPRTLGLSCTSIKTEEGDTSSIVETRIRDTIQGAREEHEIAVAKLFSNEEGWLLIDGGIGWVLKANQRISHAVGLVKSHHRQYVRSVASVNKLLGMKAGQRSALFRRPNDPRQGNEVLSCYLKLRESPEQSPFFGLVRLEIPDLAETKERIDDVAGWLLAERAPVSLPDPRFDKLLYPIHLVEMYLKSIQPSNAAVLGLLG
jgi:hypothetical protein